MGGFSVELRGVTKRFETGARTITAALLSVSLGPLVAAAAAALGGTLTTVAASLVPLSRLRRLTGPPVLAAE